jgi:uncharacterized coiled-coil protein SlyX
MIARIFKILVAAVMLGALETVAQTVRVTAVDMATTELSKQPLTETAQQLKSLTSDVILLRGVTGWKMAERLAEALRPAQYRVAACSAFASGAKPGTNAVQVAILARKTAYFCWSEAWKLEDTPSAKSGFTFAAIEVAGHRFGFFSLNLPPSEAALGPATEQWLESVNSYRGWSSNRLEGFLTATFRPLTSEGELGRKLRSVGISAVPGSSATLSQKQIVEGHLVPDAESPRGLLLSQPQMTCDFDFQSAPIVVVVTNSAPVNVQTSTTPNRANTALIQPGVWWFAVGLALLLLVIVTMLIGIRHRLNRLQAQNALVPVGSYNMVIASPTSGTTTVLAEVPSTVARIPSVPAFSERDEAITQHGFITHFAHWLKQAFVQRLIHDRQKLIADQEVAARKVSSVDERLARLETKIQQQTAAYEKEIELLNQKLLTAREENLELIRSQIKFLKSEMEATRARVLESAEP